MIEPFRFQMAKAAPAARSISLLQRLALFHITPYAGRMRWALAPARLFQWTWLDRVREKIGAMRLLPRSMRQMYEMLPRLKPHYGRLPEILPAEGRRRARVALFVGCASDAFFPETNLATARVLQRNGCEVWIPRSEEHTSELQSHLNLLCRLLLEKKKK